MTKYEELCRKINETEQAKKRIEGDINTLFIPKFALFLGCEMENLNCSIHSYSVTSDCIDCTIDVLLKIVNPALSIPIKSITIDGFKLSYSAYRTDHTTISYKGNPGANYRLDGDPSSLFTACLRDIECPSIFWK
jgi:hypothetical protein